MLYAISRFAVLIVALSAPRCASFAAIAHVRPAAAPLRSSLFLSDVKPAAEDCACSDTAELDGIVTPTKFEGVTMNDVRVTGASLRSTALVDAAGVRRTIGSVVGEEGKGVVIFLRHLGWPLCWDYALAWQKQASRMSRAGVAGPIFISVGQPEQLQKFLDVNPELKGAQALIDDSPEFAGYRAAGFNILLGDKTLDTPPDFKPPVNMGPRKWLTYLGNVAQLSPVPKDIKFGEVPQGVRVLGGTYAIEDDAVRFSHMDEVPGATPDIEDVLAAVGA